MVVQLRPALSQAQPRTYTDIILDVDQRLSTTWADESQQSLRSDGVQGNSSSLTEPAELASTSGPMPKCLGPVKAPELPPNEAAALRKRVRSTAEDWGYGNFKRIFGRLKDLRVLDVGMGQGPIGVMALAGGVKTYTGLDPALCINERAKTRNKKIPKAPSAGECEAIKRTRCAATEAACAAYLKCVDLVGRKYKLFPFTGLDMMSSFSGKLQLLPGTFASLEHTGFLQRGMFDAVTLWTVTEHLPDNRAVIEGIFKWLDPAQLLVAKHHNYYCYDGHHNRPHTPADFDKTSAFQRERANWGHLESTSGPYSSQNLNRIRLGDLFALLHVYFECAWRLGAPPEHRAVLEPNSKLLRKLAARGFNAAELLVCSLTVACSRRAQPQEAPWLDRLQGFHPPTDGSYKPQALPAEMLRKVVDRREAVSEGTPAGMSHLKKLLVTD